MNQTFTITVDVPEGWECTGEYRQPVPNEYYLRGADIKYVQAGEPHLDTGPHFILRRAWSPPSWLPIENWLYYNGSQWKLSNRQPRMQDNIPRSALGAVSIDVRIFASLVGQAWAGPPNLATKVYRI